MAPAPTTSSPVEVEASPMRYAPHPGAAAGDTWPLSMAEMTEQLLASGKQKSKHSSMIHSSAYDNRAEAAAGAAALIRASHSSDSPFAAAAMPAPPKPAFAAPGAHGVDTRPGTPPPRVQSPPSPALAASPLANVTSGAGGSPNRSTWAGSQAAAAAANLGRAAWQTALNRRATQPPPRVHSEPRPDGFVLPEVILTPPEDEGAPVSLYPTNEANDFDGPHKIYEQSLPPDGSAPSREVPSPGPRRSFSMPTVSSVAGMPEPEQPAPAPQTKGKSVFSMPAPPFGRRYSSAVAAVVMPKKAEQVKVDVDRKRFDAEWNELDSELPSPSPPQEQGAFPGATDAAPSKPKWMSFPTRAAPPPPAESSKQAQQAQQAPKAQGQAQVQARAAPPPPPPQQQQQAEATRPETPKTPKRPMTPKLPSFMTKQQATTPKADAKVENRKAHRRSMSLTAVFSKKKRTLDDDVPTMPKRAETPSGRSTTPQPAPTPKTPKSSKADKKQTPAKAPAPAQTPAKSPAPPTRAPPPVPKTSNGTAAAATTSATPAEAPATPGSQGRKMPHKRASIKDLFSAFSKSEQTNGTDGTSSRKSLRKSRSKPELTHAGNRLVAQDAPPVPSLPPAPPRIQVEGLEKQVAPDALASLTANSSSPDTPSPKSPPVTSRVPQKADTTGAAPGVEIVPDVFAAFNSSETSLLLRGMSGQLNIGKDSRSSTPAKPAATTSAAPASSPVFASTPPRTSSVQAMASAKGKGPAASTPNVSSPLAPIENKPVTDDKKANRRSRAKSLSQRLSISSLFSKKKKDADAVPDVPALPPKYNKHSSMMPPPVAKAASASTPHLPRAQSMQTPSPSKAQPGVGASDAQKAAAAAAALKPTKRISSQRVPVPKFDSAPALRASQSQPYLPGSLSKPMPALPVDETDESAEGSTAEGAGSTESQDKFSVLAATVARLEGTPPAKENKAEQQRQARAAARISQVPPPRARQASENLQKKASLNSLPHAQAQQLRSVSEPMRGAPTRSASEQSFQLASNPFQEQAPSPEVIQQAAALVCKPAPIKVVQQAEADYLHHRQQQHRPDDDDGPATPTRPPKKPSTGPLTVEPTDKAKEVSSNVGPSVASAATPVETASGAAAAAPGPAPAHMLVTPPRKARRVSVAPLKPESLNSPLANIPVPDPSTVAAPAPAPSPSTILALAPVTQAAERRERPASLAVDVDGLIINVIQPTPHRTPAQSHDGHADNEPVDTIVSPVPSVISPGIVTMAVRESMVRSTTPILTSASELSSAGSTPPRANAAGRTTPDSDADAASMFSEYSEYSLPAMPNFDDIEPIEPVLSAETDAATPVATSSDEVSPATSTPSTIRPHTEQLNEQPTRPATTRSSSVPVDEPPVVSGRPSSSVVAQSYSSTLPTRLSISPVSSPVDAERPQLRSRASASGLFASVAAAASTVKSAVSTALADASVTLDDLDEKIENSVRAASPNVLALTNARLSQRPSSTVARPAPSRSSSASSAGSVYDTPMSDITAPSFSSASFSSPSDSTASFETASSNATVSPLGGGVSLAPLPAYSNSRRPPSMHAEFEDLPLVEPITQRQAKGFVPPALVAAAARRRSVSTPVESRCTTPRASTMGVPPPVPSLSAESARIPAANCDERPSSLPYVHDGETTDEGSSREPSTIGHDRSDDADKYVRTDSPVDMGPDADDAFVVPFEAEDKEPDTPSSAEPTVNNYPLSSAVREQARRASSGLRGGVRDALSGLGFARRSQVDPGVNYGRTAAHSPNFVQPMARDSVNVDYGTPSTRNSTAVGLGMWDEADETEPESSVEADGSVGFRETKLAAGDDVADSSFDSAEYSSSGSDDVDGSPCTPRTPDLETLTEARLPGTPSSPTPPAADAGVNAKRATAAAGGTTTRTREPFRAMHYDMSQEGTA